MGFFKKKFENKFNKGRLARIGIIFIIIPGVIISGFIIYFLYFSDKEPISEKLKDFTGNYYFHDKYTVLLKDLKELNETFPEQTELFSLNTKFGYSPTVKGHEIWCLRITNESSGFNKPEVLYIGSHHGNEIVSVETAFWYGHWLLDNYGKNERATFLVNNREIYIVPCLNPDGRYASTPSRTNGRHFDLNRDYDYAPEIGHDGPFSEIETKCIRDLSEEHQFIISIDWHQGFYGIYCPWGIYFREAQISPDHATYNRVANLMSNQAGSFGSGNYPIYNAGPLYGSWRDWAYASHVEYGGNFTQDPDGYFSGGQLAFIVELSYHSSKSEDIELGGTLNDGWVPKNIRLALVAAELATPYINLVETPPDQILIGSSLKFTWQVLGCLEVNETVLEWSNSTVPDSFSPISNVSLSSKFSLYRENFTMTTLPLDTLGKKYYRVCAKVDAFSNSSSVAYASEIFSRYAKLRNWPKWKENVTSNGIYQELEGQLYWYSDIIEVNVVDFV
ncbi:MAG: M14 family zinc carboxypeptidase [Candidatus Hermodarchaeota archaeon]